MQISVPSSGFIFDFARMTGRLSAIKRIAELKVEIDKLRAHGYQVPTELSSAYNAVLADLPAFIADLKYALRHDPDFFYVPAELEAYQLPVLNGKRIPVSNGPQEFKSEGKPFHFVMTAAPGTYHHNSETTAVITWPDGRTFSNRVKPTPVNLADIGVHLYTTAETGSSRSVTKFISPYENGSRIASRVIELNWLTRPSLTDTEIKLMWIQDIANLYYGILHVAVGKDPCFYYDRPHAVVSAGMGNWWIKYETELRDRIYRLRTDLHSVTDGKNTFRVLVPPASLIPVCPSNDGIGMGLSIAGMLLQWIPFLGQALSIAGAAYSDVEKQENMSLMSDESKQATAMGKEIANGLTLLKTRPPPQPTSQQIAELHHIYDDWQRRISRFDTSVFNEDSYHIQGSAPFLIDANGGHEACQTKWKPYRECFLSKYVASIVTNTGGSHVQSTVSSTKPVKSVSVGNLLNPYI